MDTLENMWNKLSLLDSKENSVQCSEDSLARPSLAAKFLTKRLTNIESVARTSKPLWRTQREFKIKDMGENLTFLKFENECDLERVLEHEPWTYDNHLVIFEKVLENVPISALPFKLTTIWVQIHDLPVHCMNPATRDSIGNSLGTVLQMTDSEEEGGKGNCLQSSNASHSKFQGTLTAATPLPMVAEVEKEGGEGNAQNLDYQQILKSIDDEIGYKSPSTLVIDSNFRFGMANSNCNAPLKSKFHAKQKSGQSKPIPEAQDKTLSHPTNGPTLEVKSTCLSAPT
nr:hypothetical protein CFP56_78070 [Quercus suber]